ncbi:MAG: carboxypeptidase regulatory-like domain-containing protein [Planctomycetes bacterium]|nr:carboxypeptidase regulatory-like domain-containing protein [Planctomycetota bacterium]
MTGDAPKPTGTRAFALAVPALLLCGVALFAWAMRSAAPPRLTPSTVVHTSADSSVDAGGGSRDSREAAPLDDPLAGAPEATRVLESPPPPSGPDPLRPLDPREERRREQAGRATLCGLVLAPDGVPVAGAKLFVDGALVGRSDARGAYRIEFAHDVLDGATTIAAMAESIGSRVVPFHGPGRRLDLQLEAGRAVEGRAVEWRGGRPIAGATVDLLARSNFDGTSATCFALTTRSDSAGAFRFAGVPDGSVELRARTAEADTLAFRPCSIAAESEATLVELELRRCVAVRGRFAPWPPRGFVSEAPREARAWTIGSGARWFDGRDFRAPIDGDGRFELLLPEFASYTLALAAGDEALWCETFTLPPDAAPVDLGRVAWSDATMLVGSIDVPADVAALGLVVRGSAQYGDASIEFERRCAADGSFSIGPYPLESVEFEFACRERVLHRAEPIELRRGGGRIELGLLAAQPAWFGRVVDEAGRPFAHATVVLEVGGRRARPMESTDAEGWFSFLAGAETDRTDEAARELVVTARGLAAHRFAVSRPATAVARLPDLVVRSDPAAVVQGLLREADGTLVVGARVTLQSGSRDDLHDVTGSDGRFEFRGLVVEAARVWPVVVEFPDGRELVTAISAGHRELEWVVPSPDPSESR